MRINKNTTIEDIVSHYPHLVRVLMEKGITCIACGQPVWGTLEENAREKGLSDQEIDDLVDELNRMVASPAPTVRCS